MLYNVPIECHSNACCSLVFQKCRLQGGSNGPQFMILFATLEVVFSWPDLVSPWGEIPVKDGIIQTLEASHTMTAHPWTSRAFLVLYFAERKRRIPFPFARKVNGCLRECMGQSRLVRLRYHLQPCHLPQPTGHTAICMPDARE